MASWRFISRFINVAQHLGRVRRGVRGGVAPPREQVRRPRARAEAREADEAVQRPSGSCFSVVIGAAGAYSMPRMKTNAARILDSLGIPYELRTYEVDPSDLTAGTVARKVGLPPEQVWKTLVARGDRHGVCFAVVPGNAQLDLKAIARLTGDRKVDTVPLKEVQPLTGYVRGGVTALGAKKAYPVYADETIELFDVVSVSAGVRGTQILVAPGDYLRATKAKVGPIAVPGGDAD
ncbi:Cys-tRNA(Pro) deacylase [Sorangium sp. So ce134]